MYQACPSKNAKFGGRNYFYNIALWPFHVVWILIICDQVLKTRKITSLKFWSNKSFLLGDLSISSIRILNFCDIVQVSGLEVDKYVVTGQLKVLVITRTAKAQMQKV